MKKYLAAGGAAVVAFAFAASAASFTIGDSVLASGEGDVTDCGAADIDYTTLVTGEESFGIDTLTITFDEPCEGNFVNLATFNQDPDASGADISGSRIEQVDANDTATFDTNPSTFDVADLEYISVLVRSELQAGESVGWSSGVLAP
jgi:hypothetical protein